MEPQQLWTNTAESQSPQPKTVDSQPSRSARVICKTDPSPVEPVKTLDPILEETNEHCNHQAYVGDSQSEASTTDAKRESPKTISKRFKLWHKRFAHCDPEKLRYLHKVTSLKKRIQILSSARRSRGEV